MRRYIRVLVYSDDFPPLWPSYIAYFINHNQQSTMPSYNGSYANVSDDRVAIGGALFSHEDFSVLFRGE